MNALVRALVDQLRVTFFESIDDGSYEIVGRLLTRHHVAPIDARNSEDLLIFVVFLCKKPNEHLMMRLR